MQHCWPPRLRLPHRCHQNKSSYGLVVNLLQSSSEEHGRRVRIKRSVHRPRVGQAVASHAVEVVLPTEKLFDLPVLTAGEQVVIHHHVELVADVPEQAWVELPLDVAPFPTGQSVGLYIQDALEMSKRCLEACRLHPIVKLCSETGQSERPTHGHSAILDGHHAVQLTR